MRISAIRLAEIGRFSEPVAIEHLSGGLDVLAGPNELGKSTLLKALQLAFFEKYNTAKKDVKDLRPYGGGAPTVEVEFEADNRRYRLRKRFLAQATAELRDLSGHQLLRGPEAEAELARIVGGPGVKPDGSKPNGVPGRFGLVWVGQRRSLEPLAPADVDDGLPTLHRALAREVEAVAAGGRTKQLHGEVRRLLGEVMGHAGTRPKGAYDAALKALKAKTTEHAAAAADLALALERIERLGGLRTAEAALAAPATVAGRKARIGEARAAHDAAQAARARRDVLAQTLKAAEAALAEHRRQAEDFNRLLAALETAAGAAARLATGQQTLATEAEAMAAGVEIQRRHIETLRRERTGLDRHYAAAIAAERLKASAQRAAELAGREADARSLTVQEAALAKTLAATRATPGLLRTAAATASSIRALQARLEAAAPAIIIDYVAGGEGRLAIGGRRLASGEKLLASEPLVIEIAGIGWIHIAPGGGAVLADTRAELDRGCATLAQHLAEAGVADLAALETAVEDRRASESRLAGIRTRLLGLAPLGLDHLVDERRAAETLATEFLAATEAAGNATAPHPSRSAGEIAAAASALAASLTAAEQSLESAHTKHAGLREKLAGLAAEADANHRRLAELNAALPPPGEARQAKREALFAAVAAAETAVNRTVRDLAAWTEQTPAAAALDAMQTACATAEAAARTADAELARIRMEAARLEGALTEARDEDVATRAELLAQAVERLQVDVRRFEEDVAALQLLDDCLAEEEARTRAVFLTPVMTRLGPYLATLFPNAQIAFDQSFAPAGLERNRVAEPLEHISDGTQEQIAVLVRLAFARLFADTGSPVPLILDDALVYADDQRIAAMFRALETAAEQHQVIVLTCRTLAFERLRGRRLSLVPWLQAAAA